MADVRTFEPSPPARGAAIAYFASSLSPVLQSGKEAGFAEHGGWLGVYQDMPEQPCILLAEDYEAIRQFMTMILSAEGYRVLHAENGRVALTLFHEHRESIKMLITDRSMPGMTGAELIAAVRKIAPALPVLVCSSSIQRGEKYLTDDIRCIEKPFPHATFVSTVAEMWRAASPTEEHDAPAIAEPFSNQRCRPWHPAARRGGVLVAGAAILCASVWVLSAFFMAVFRGNSLPAALRLHGKQIPINIESAVKALR